MRWLLLLHIATMIGWCGFLLYMPALISISAGQGIPFEAKEQVILPRLFFTHILTPIALIAIISGTFIFVQQNTIAMWLMAKLSLVSVLVMIHAFNGWLILKMESKSQKNLNRLCLLTGIVTFLFITAIISLVLLKPDIGQLA
ncbi:CopD family protein [Legionella impletisoli]|uniref:Protoporphyrinogen IX oxidase n=1 Tax=Legionella impletisoli TaxID=343510 RepID=A0A917JZE9_9GAMM|nr:CopD family protein [Legionella impletisoli]GGI90276.1 hypothetical protein GCM10007966_18830 [Legionella impletisoli]